MKRLVLSFWSVFLFPQLAFAQENGELGQQLVEEGLRQGDKYIPGGTLAIAAYIALWFMLLTYFVFLTIHLRKLRSDVVTLEKRVDELFGS